MSITALRAAALADRLDQAQQTVTDVISLAQSVDLTIDEAYEIQRAVVERRLRRGEYITGVKLGFTSKAKMTQMGVSEVIVGTLTDGMRVRNGADLDLSAFIHPKVEPEVAYRISRDVDVDDPGLDVAAHIDAVAPALEIIDSRYQDFVFTYTDVVADNTSAAAYVVGAWQPLTSVADRAVWLRSGEREVVGSTAAILDDPIRAVHALVGICRRRGIPLEAGQVILAGAATEAIPLTEGVVEGDIAGLGTVTVRATR